MTMRVKRTTQPLPSMISWATSSLQYGEAVHSSPILGSEHQERRNSETQGLDGGLAPASSLSRKRFSTPIESLPTHPSDLLVRGFSRYFVMMGLLVAASGLTSCEEGAPASGPRQLAEEAASASCREQDRGALRATNDPAASTYPTLAVLGDGHVLAWIDDRFFPASIYLQKIDPLGRPQGELTRFSAGERPSRPQIASSDEEICLVYHELDADGTGRAMLRLFDHELAPLEGEPVELGTADLAHTAGLIRQGDQYLVGLPSSEGLELIHVAIEAGGDEQSSDAASAPDAGSPDAAVASSGPTVRISRRTVPLAEGMNELGNVNLLFHEEHLYIASDHPEGWSIQIGEVGRDSVRRFSQVVDDRRNPEIHWSYPAIGGVANGRIALLWQGPGMGLSSLYLLLFDPEGNPQGMERPFEGHIIDEATSQVVGRAPIFHPTLAPASFGLLAAFADNRYSNSEILLAPFSCGESR